MNDSNGTAEGEPMSNLGGDITAVGLTIDGPESVQGTYPGEEPADELG